jgi:hypothetical protein
MKNVIGRILGLTAKSNDLKNQKANLDLTGKDTTDVKFQISLTKILLHSAKTNPDNDIR